jgi:transposase
MAVPPFSAKRFSPASTGRISTSSFTRSALCHSRAFFLVAYPRESQEMVFDAHAKAFEFLGGVPRRGIYDNLKPA